MTLTTVVPFFVTESLTNVIVVWRFLRPLADSKTLLQPSYFLWLSWFSLPHGVSILPHVIEATRMVLHRTQNRRLYLIHGWGGRLATARSGGRDLQKVTHHNIPTCAGHFSVVKNNRCKTAKTDPTALSPMSPHYHGCHYIITDVSALSRSSPYFHSFPGELDVLNTYKRRAPYQLQSSCLKKVSST